MNESKWYYGVCERCGADMEPTTPLEVDDSSDYEGVVYVLVECAYHDHGTFWAEPENW